MKRLLTYTLIIGICLGACSKKEEKEAPNLDTYQATVKENFTDPFKRIENIQVEDFIPYTLAIEDSGDDENVEYRLTSVRESQDYHQTIGKDFGLYLKKDDNAPYDLEKKYISFSKKGSYNFYIRPFVPGTFKLNFELRKFINNKPIGKAVKINITFNAVKITVGYEKKLDEVNIDKYYYSYYIIINDGDEEGDTYLNAQNIIQKCTVTFMREGKEWNSGGNRTILPNKKFEYAADRYTNSPDIHSVPIRKIRIAQVAPNLSEFVIEYYNIKY